MAFTPIAGLDVFFAATRVYFYLGAPQSYSQRSSYRHSFSGHKRSVASQRYHAVKEGDASVPRVWCELGVLGSSLRSVRVAACAPITISRTYCFSGSPLSAVSAVPAGSAFQFRSTPCFTARARDAVGRHEHPSGPARVARLGQLPRVRARHRRRSAGSATRRGWFSPP
ncbi:hypothetical protein NDU88_005199 [Pleurodeles waltl]|uniref:Uncharacterized protein n=1 Tax=Pleurodeles waltl TaxID=8319 RepID=A0AAV7VJ59_PLEWA|nr:hypothetical protein NDU88_005199 [Pleurodeles waltl]